MINRRRKKSKKKYLIILLILFLISSSLIMNENNLTKIERIIKTGGLAITSVVSYPFDIAKNSIKVNINATNLKKENEKLKQQLKEYENIKMENEELKYQIDSLIETLELNQGETNNYINAKVINRSIGGWYLNITIDKGEKNGIKVGMPVIVKDGLVGVVDKVTDYFSTISLLTSNKVNNISVKIAGDKNYSYGILRKYEDRLFKIEVLDKNKDIKENSIVTTTGLTNNFPGGIILGKVEEILVDNFGLSTELKIKSNVNFEKLEYVTVVIK